MRPDKLGEHEEDVLVDFFLWLAKERLIESQEMPSGAMRYGRTLRDPVEIIRSYWETYQ